MPVAIAHAKEIVADKKLKTHGVWERFAAMRFLHDLEQSKKRGAPFRFSADQANRACRFMELMPHVEGTWDSKTIVLVPAQVLFIVNLFGFRDPSGGRRFTTALYAVARKNAKSTLAAAIELYVLCEEDEPGAQIFAAATTGSQARVVWSIAKAMCDRLHALQTHYGVLPMANTIARRRTNSFFKPINAKASTQDGLNPQSFVLDEVHAHKTHDLYNVLTSAAGARRNPLFLYTTTEGYETPGPWPEIRAFAKSILQGAIEADHVLAFIYSIDEDDQSLGTKADDDFSENAWRKANPLYDHNPILRQKIRELAIEAKAMPGKLGEFRIKRLNRQSAAAKAWIDLMSWNKCDGPVDPDGYPGYQCWAAFDLSSTTDMTSWCVLWKVEDRWHAKLRYWVPQESARKRAEKRSAPYQAWVQAGFVAATEGNVVDYAVVEQAIKDDVQVYQPTKITYDPWNAQQLVTNLTQDGMDLEVFVQGPRSYHPAMQALEVAYMRGLLNHGGNPVLKWNAANLVPRYDVNLNMAPDKKRSADKIDGMCALLMAMGIAIIDVDDGSSGFFTQPVRANG